MADTELWRAELGDRVARCLLGENSSVGDRIVAGRAYRGIRERRVDEFLTRFGKKLPWSHIAEQRARSAARR